MSDTIDRQAAIDYFVTNVGFHDEDGYPIEDECELREIWTRYFDGIPSAQPTFDARDTQYNLPIGTDLISRQAAIDALHMDTSIIPFKKAREYADATISEIRNRLEKLPPAEPKRGKWKNIVDGIEYTWGTCDSCGARIPMPYKYYKYCPNCGADMRGEQDG